MKITIKKFILFAALLVLSSTAGADSYYSSFGLGIPHYFVSPQAGGMGGAGMAVQQYLSLNQMNPAGIDLKGFTMISASFQGEIVNNTVSGETVQTRKGSASGFRFVIPLKKNRLAFIAGLKPLTESELSFDFQQQFNDFNLIRNIGMSGGLSAASIGLKYAIFPRLSIGGVFNFNFGAFNEKWSTEFDDDSYLDTNDDISSHMWGAGAEFGLIYKPTAFVSLAGILRTKSKLHIGTTITPGSGIAMSPIDQKASYPLAYGFGAAVDLTKFLIAADFYSQQWSNYLLDGNKSAFLTNFVRGSAGIEYVASKDYLTGYARRVAYRLGASWAQLPFLDQQAKPVKELLGTIGFGFPFNKNLGRIDLAVEAGKRFSTSSAPYSERIVRVSACVTSAEQWFKRIF